VNYSSYLAPVLTSLVISYFPFLFGMIYYCELSDFEETLWTYPTSKLEYYQKAYAFKTLILGRVTSNRLLEQEEAFKKMSRESKNLKRDFNLAQAANLDLEKKVVDLANALKKCQDEKKIAEDEKCNDLPTSPRPSPPTPGSSLGPQEYPHRPTHVFLVHFALSHAHPGRTFRSVTHRSNPSTLNFRVFSDGLT
jgi:hypothetical protein